MWQRKAPRERAFNPHQGLLGKQLASITITLTQASKRRDSEVEKRVSRGTSRASTPTPAPPILSPKPLVPYPLSSSPNGSTSGSLGSNSVQIAHSPTCDDRAVEAYQKEDLSEEYGIVDPLPLPSSLTRMSLRGGEASELDDPRRLLAEFDQKVGTRAKPKDQMCKEGDLEELREQLSNLLSPSREERTNSHDIGHAHLPPQNSLVTRPPSGDMAQQNAVVLRKEDLPYVAALQFEKAECKWEEVRAWTEYLYSEGFNGHISQHRKDVLIQQALRELDAVKAQVLQEEIVYHAAEEQASLPCRLIVTNVAADCDDEELAMLFSPFKFEIRNLFISDERHPINRTRIAYVDMYTREAAKQASYTIGSVFGLMVNVRLAVEGDG